MFEFKYFRKIDAARADEIVHPSSLAEFDIGDLGVSGAFTRQLLRRSYLIVFWLLRRFWPNAAVGRLVIVSRYADVKAVLADSETFVTPFGPEMRDLSQGADFALGVEGAKHVELNRLIRSVMRPGDGARIQAIAERWTNGLLNGSGGRIDFYTDLCARVATETCSEYFGLNVVDSDAFAEWTTAMNALLFADWFGNLKTRRLALAGAERARSVITQAIERARKRPDTTRDSVLDRLLALQGEANGPTDAVICATLMGLATGFIPTTVLAAANIFDELSRRPQAMDQAKDAATNNPPALAAILLEAARLFPTLSPGQLRYAKADATIAPGTPRMRKVKAGSVILVATMSALRDPSAYASPNQFDASRKSSPELLFGFGPHWCLGQFVAEALLTSIFVSVLRQDNLRTVGSGVGAAAFAGPYPRRMDLEFGPAESPAQQSMIMICAPVRSEANLEQIKRDIRLLGNPAGEAMTTALRKSNIVHFASMSLADLGAGDDKTPHILFELNVDGDAATALRLVADDARELLEPIFREVDGPKARPLAETLQAYMLDLGASPWRTTGLNFNGTSEFPVTDIDQQQKLATFAAKMLDEFERTNAGAGEGAMERLEFVRSRARDIPCLQDFLMRPNRRGLAFADWTARSYGDGFQALLTSTEGRHAILAFVASSAAIGLALYFVFFSGGLLTDWWTFMLRGVIVLAAGAVASASVVAVFTLAFIAALRFHESRDVAEDRNPDVAAMAAIAAIENRPGFSQNHITAITPLKPGWFRKLSLAIALLGIRLSVSYWFRPGFVVTMGTIHYAKWFRPPGSDTLVFLSNYDGSWESYLEDFITRAHWGQSAAWSNAQGFPKTRYLIYDGAQDGDRFKRWVRRQQVPTQFWFSRFPALTTDRIRTNALIHYGLMRGSNDTEARAWLDLFGSQLLPRNALETDEIQSLVFRGLRNLPFVTFAVVRLPDSSGDKQAWLGYASSQISFGDRPFGNPTPDQIATFVAFSATGLEKLGLPPDATATFPAPFELGMANRADILRDVGDSEPSRWDWTDGARPLAADAAVFLFGRSPEACQRALEAHKALLGDRHVVHEVRTQPGAKGLDFEHFGFRDGISQPIIRGSQRETQNPPARDLVEPGEFILGYLNNDGFFPPSPTVNALADPKRRLPNQAADLPSVYPNFGSQSEPAARDFGRNGTFVAVRQLKQDVEGFKANVKRLAEEAARYPALASIVGHPIDGDWVAAKMLGRWQDGTPLIHGPGDPEHDRTRDNNFDYGVDDPQGLQCPLGAHIRRANPRTSLQPGDPQEQAITNRHRILRRGRSYEEAGEKGLLFVALCADLERQFEFIQQTWLTSPHFQGLQDESDPIVGSYSDRDKRAESKFTIPTVRSAVVLKGVDRFVTMRGGGYFFLPSRSSVAFLLDVAARPER